jgi:prevent-host-death family protein
MKTESLREVRNNLSAVIEELRQSGAVLITKSGRTRALLIPVDEVWVSVGDAAPPP